MAEPDIVAPAPADAEPGKGLQVLQQTIVLAVLLLVYTSIPVATLIFGLFQLLAPLAPGDAPRIDEHWFVSFLGTLSGAQKSILELIHKLVLPLAALFVGANLQRLKSGWLASSLFLVPLIGVLASLGSALLFDSFASISVRAAYPQIPTLFTDMASNLGVFTLLMVGVSLAGDQTNK